MRIEQTGCRTAVAPRDEVGQDRSGNGAVRHPPATEARRSPYVLGSSEATTVRKSIVRPEITRRPLMGQLSDGEMRAHPAEEVRIGITAFWRSSDFMLRADHDEIGVFADDRGPHRPATVRGGQVHIRRGVVVRNLSSNAVLLEGSHPSGEQSSVRDRGAGPNGDIIGADGRSVHLDGAGSMVLDPCRTGPFEEGPAGPDERIRESEEISPRMELGLLIHHETARNVER